MERNGVWGVIDAPLKHIKLQSKGLLFLIWDFFLILLTHSWEKQSNDERRAYCVRCIMAVFLINGLYVLSSLLFYYVPMPDWSAYWLSIFIILPLRKAFALNGIHWEVSVGSGPNTTVMTTSLVTIASWEQYLAVLISVSLVFAFLTDPIVWKKIGSSLRNIQHHRSNEVKLDSFFQR